MDTNVGIDSVLKLTRTERHQVFAAADFNKFSAKTKEVYSYLTEKLEELPNVKCIPGGVVAAIMGLKYDKKEHRQKFKIRQLLASSADFSQCSKKELFNEFKPVDGDLEFDIPGETSKKYIISKNDGNRSQYIFVTPKCAMRLVLSGNNNACRYIRELHLNILEILKPNVVETLWSNSLNEAFEVTDAEFRGTKTLDEGTLHDRVRDYVAGKLNGNAESRNSVGIADVETCWQTQWKC